MVVDRTAGWHATPLRLFGIDEKEVLMHGTTMNNINTTSSTD